ncbi:unnamed protein product [Schistosoma margrebowiei]|uniref:Uncharacterized protein n=1 Tax=Schistosoma margrebowiei TaxID=48269 RepID=A0A183L931_9TREM|nr:unnamed protein product [Schistosoma margrebowiei]
MCETGMINQIDVKKRTYNLMVLEINENHWTQDEQKTLHSEKILLYSGHEEENALHKQRVKLMTPKKNTKYLYILEKSRIQRTGWIQLDYLDFTDGVVLSYTPQQMQVKITSVAAAVSASVGLNMYKGKNARPQNTSRITTTDPITLDRETVEEVETFTNLVSMIDKQGRSDAGVNARIGTWNARTMWDTGRAFQIAAEMKRYNIGVLGISETHWTQVGQQQLASGELLLYSGHDEENSPHTKGVALMLSKQAQNALMGWESRGARIIKAYYGKKKEGISMNVIPCYAPTNDYNEDAKDQFYDRLQ